jgi:hypothetical protein
MWSFFDLLPLTPRNSIMLSKYLTKIGLVACVLLVISCFLPWAYYADLNQNFTGFYSWNNNYGKPGYFLVILTSVIFIFMLVPKIWAKRTNLFLCALAVGYAIKSYILFTACYNAYCPEKKIGIYLMFLSALMMLVASAFPDLKLTENKKKEID